MKKTVSKNSLKAKKTPSRLHKASQYIADNQIGFPLKIIGFIVGGYFLRLPYFEHFIFITNQRADGRFEKSFWDLAFLFFYVNVFTAARAFFLNYVFIPFAKYCQAPINKHQRFAEQSWACVYWSLASAFGIYVMKDSPWWFDSSYFWRDYPHYDYSKSFKYYYLLQFAYWLQQIFVLQIEAPRKDYQELVLHHINTLLMVSLSYLCNYIRAGNAVFVCMDLPDAILALAKALNYVCPGVICNLTFAAMFVTWMYTRVYLYGKIIISTMVEPELYVPVFVLDPLNGQYFPHFAKYIMIGLMSGLYLLILFWTMMIFKVLIKMVVNNEAKDVRSDDEDEDVNASIEKIEGDHSTLKATAQTLKDKLQ